VQPPYPGARVDAELVAEYGAKLLVRVQRPGDMTRPVQGDHQEAPEVLVHGMPRGQPRQLPQYVAMPVQRQVGLDTAFEYAEPGFLERSRLGLQDPSLADVDQCGPAPQVKRAPEQIGDGLRLSGLCRLAPGPGQAAELVDIGTALKLVPGVPGAEELAGDPLT
jgi:hypothetical protein